MATPHPASPAPPVGNGLAVAGMILGILGLALCWIPFVGALVALLGIVFGAIGWSKASRTGRNKGMAITGVVCGILGVVAGIVIVVFALLFSRAVEHGLDDAKVELAKAHVDKFANEFYPQWMMHNDDKGCPDATIEDVGRAIDIGMRERELQDPWGHRMHLSCSAQGAFKGVYSFGPDGQDDRGEGDDIASWKQLP